MVFDKGFVEVRIGEHNLATTGEGSLPEMTLDVASYTNHEKYKFPHNDITIIELAQEVDLTTYTPACLAKTTDTNTFDGKKAWVYGEMTEMKIAKFRVKTVLGWGTLAYGTWNYPDQLMELEVTVVTNKVCRASMGSGITEGMICAGGLAGEDACQVNIRPRLLLIRT